MRHVVAKRLVRNPDGAPDPGRRAERYVRGIQHGLAGGDFGEQVGEQGIEPGAGSVEGIRRSPHGLRSRLPKSFEGKQGSLVRVDPVQRPATPFVE